jgi:hypothetical protein
MIMRCRLGILGKVKEKRKFHNYNMKRESTMLGSLFFALKIGYSQNLLFVIISFTL